MSESGLRVLRIGYYVNADITTCYCKYIDKIKMNMKPTLVYKSRRWIALTPGHSISLIFYLFKS